MRRLVGAGIAVLTSTGLLAAMSEAAIQSPTGDTCVVNGNGTAYTVVINLPPNAPEQGGFAFGASGVKITNVRITDTGGGGSLSTQNLPANTTAAWNLAGPTAVPGASITASLTTSAPVTGSFSVVPANGQHTAYYDPIVCEFPKGTPTPSNKFTVQRQFIYNAASGTWHSFVSVPGPGKVNYSQRKTRPSDTAALLVRSGTVSVRAAGKVKLTLRPTAAGKSALAKSRSITLSLSIEFSPKNGKPANKLFTVTLKT
jgi:hypothetical protein